MEADDSITEFYTQKSELTIIPSIADKCKVITVEAACVADTDCIYKKLEKICFKDQKWIKMKHLPSSSNVFFATTDRLRGEILSVG